VTGASGHLGRNVLKLLSFIGVQVRVLIFPDCDIGHIPSDRENVKIFYGDVLEKDSLRPFISGADYVIHLANMISLGGKNQSNMMKVNVEGTSNISDICLEEGIKRLIYLSSMHAFEFLSFDLEVSEKSKKSNPKEHGMYAYSKVLAEGELRKRIKKGLDVVILNPSGILGPLDYRPSKMGEMILEYFNNDFLPLTKGGCHYVDVRDVSQVVISAIEKGVCGENYIISEGYYTNGDLFELFHKASGFKKRNLELPLLFLYPLIPFYKLEGYLMDKEPKLTGEAIICLEYNEKLNSEKVKRELGFSPRPIIETIEDIFISFIESEYIKLDNLLGEKKEKLENLLKRKNKISL